MVYKKQVIAGDIPEVKPYDTTKMFRTISETANGIANATAKLAEQNFMNRFDIEQRKQLNECYERNLNNPKQLEIEQQKIKLNLVKALPNSKMRNEAMARFEMHAMTVEEAILQMNLIGHAFYAFTDADSGDVCVVYKRKEGSYGLIAPER